MTFEKACQILGIAPGSGIAQIKKRYRQLMLQLHPDMGTEGQNASVYQLHEIHEAYDFLKKARSRNKNSACIDPKNMSQTKSKKVTWDAPVNDHAYREREILHYAEDSDGSILGSFCITKEKYLWKTEEDFPLFLLSIYRCSKSLLDEIDETLQRNSPSARALIQPELAYLLAQQYIDGTSLLQELAKKVSTDDPSSSVFYISATLELTKPSLSPKPGEFLYPARLKQHRLYLKNRAGYGIGYLSFPDDRLYYVVIPLFEQRKVQVKIQTSLKQISPKYPKLDLWIRFCDNDKLLMTENLNLQIQDLLLKYRNL